MWCMHGPQCLCTNLQYMGMNNFSEGGTPATLKCMVQNTYLLGHVFLL